VVDAVRGAEKVAVGTMEDDEDGQRGGERGGEESEGGGEG
jgi:hypothetical protein